MSLKIGNIPGFTSEAMLNIIYVLGMGYMGGSISALSHLSDTEINEIFPYDTKKLPYVNKHATPVGDVGILESLWPMKSLGFPYSNRYNSKELQYQFINWMIDTCAYLFATIRHMYSFISKKGGVLSKYFIGDLFVFYVMPYILMYLIIPPIIPFVYGFVALVGSLKVSNSCGFMFTLAPFTAWFYGISLCKEINIMCLITTFIIGIIGCCMPMVFIPWWICISWCVWAYSIIVLLFSPFLYENGIKKVFHEIMKHKISLIVIFMYLTLKTSLTYLIQPVAAGLLLGTVYVLYGLLKKS